MLKPILATVLVLAMPAASALPLDSVELAIRLGPPPLPCEALGDCHAWASEYDGEGENDYWLDQAVSPDGATVYVTGTSITLQNGNDVITAAYDAETGAEIWFATHDGAAHGTDVAQSIALNDGRVVVAGFSQAATLDFLVIAYDAASGAKLWETSHAGPVYTFPSFADVSVAAGAGKIVVAGAKRGADNSPDIHVFALDAATGNALWSASYDGTGLVDGAAAVALSGDGSKALVTGLSWGGDVAAYDAVTIAYDTQTGSQLWASRHNEPTSETEAMRAIAVAGDLVIAAGQAQTVTHTNDVLVVAYDAATGTEAWSYRYTSPGDRDDIAWDIAIAGEHVVAAAHGATPDASGPLAIALDLASGQQEWVALYDPPATNGGYGYAIAASADGESVALAGTINAGRHICVNGFCLRPGYAFAAVFDAATGTSQWTGTYDGSNTAKRDVFNAISLRDDGRVLASGYARNADTGSDATVVAFDA